MTLGGISLRILALLIAIFIWIALTLMIRATVDFQYCRREENDHFEIRLSALHGLWKFNLQVPTVQLEWEKGPQIQTQETSIAPTGEKRKSRNKIKFRYFNRGFFYHFIPQLPKMLIQLQRVKNKFYRGIHCTLVDWKVGIGYEDPAETAIVAGSFWGMLSYSLARLYRQVTMETKEPRIQVEPNFQKQGFRCTIHCIFNLRIGHIMFVGLDLVRIFMRGKRRNA
jgi:hypothetical protein